MYWDVYVMLEMPMLEQANENEEEEEEKEEMRGKADSFFKASI